MFVSLAAAAIAALIALPRLASAQGGGISAVSVSANHRLMGDGLLGGAAHARFPFGDGRRSVRLSAERLTGDAHRTGVPCSGLIMPGTCSPEPLRDDARLNSVSGGLGLQVLALPRLVVEVAGDLRLGWISANTRGLESGRSLSTDKSLWGGDVGIDVAWSPRARLPLALEVGIAAGRLMPLPRENVLDGYTPFNDGFRLTRLRVGLAWRPSTR